MSPEIRLLVAASLATATAYFATGVAIRAAARFEFYDHPVGYKGHATPTPLLGGTAVMAAFLLALLLLANDLDRTVPLVFGVAVLWLVGTLDDRRGVSPSVRIAIELALAVMLAASGLGWDIGLGTLGDGAVTCLWVVAVVNAFNLFDNMDGASSSMALVVSLAVAALGVVDGDPWLTASGAALSGACLGFLPHNLARPNARIFLGDGGSMPVGFAVAALVMIGASRVAGEWQALILGLFLVGVPALDTALVIVSRRRKGISVLTGGRDHLTHRTRRRLRDARAVAMALGGAQAILASLALVAVDGGPMFIVAVTIALLALAGGVITILERQEDRLRDTGELIIPPAALQHAEEKRMRRPDPLTVGDAALVILAVGCGVSPLFFGFYDSSHWVPIGIGLVLVGAAGAIRRPPALTGRAWLVLGGLAGIGIWALVSAAWAEAADQANVDGNRWLVLAAVFGLGLVLVRSARRETLALAGLAAGILVVAAVVVVRMLGGEGSDLFLNGRIQRPLGYINAEATVFLMGAWLCLGAAERREPWLAGLGMGAASLLSCLALLSQSRGAAIAALGSIVVVLAVLPGRQRRAFALLLLGGGLALAWPSLSDVYGSARASGNLRPDDAVVADAAVAALLVAIATGAVWGLGCRAYARLLVPERHAYERALVPEAPNRVAQAGRAILALMAAVVLVVGLASADRIGSRIDREWTTFTRTADPAALEAMASTGGTRLFSGAGNRYEYWRVAWNTFTDHPVRGLGAGNYDRAWFDARMIDEDVRQPHSIQLQALSELGLVGGALLLLVLVGVTLGIARARRAPPFLAVATVGVSATFLVHTSVDWHHLIPGVAAVAVVCFAVLSRRREEAVVAPLANRGRAIAVSVGVALLVAVSGATLTRQALADHFRDAAFRKVASDPRQAIVDADRSLRLNAEAVRSYYAKAAALARLDRGEAAEQTLLAATRREPRDFVTWGLLGDLATRRGFTADAAHYYRRALELNPQDPELRRRAAASEEASK